MVSPPPWTPTGRVVAASAGAWAKTGWHHGGRGIPAPVLAGDGVPRCPGTGHPLRQPLARRLPAEDSYSRVTNPQRLAPLITVTEALINHLESEYQVRCTTEGSVTVLDPGPTAAGLRFDVDPVGFVVRVTAGPVAEFVFPVCACDACDETAEPLADDLEATVFAVVAGQLRQRVERRGLVIEIGGGRRVVLLVAAAEERAPQDPSASARHTRPVGPLAPTHLITRVGTWCPVPQLRSASGSPRAAQSVSGKTPTCPVGITQATRSGTG